jgi:hypothetical protein
MAIVPDQHDPDGKSSWALDVEIHASRQTIWRVLGRQEFWRRAWGKSLQIRLAQGELMLDETGEIMPVSVGVFAQLVPFDRFDMFWFLGREGAQLPEEVNSSNGIHLRLAITPEAPGVNRVSVVVLDRGKYPARGGWAAKSRKVWLRVLGLLREFSERTTTM